MKPKGTERSRKRRKTRQHKSKEGEGRKSTGSINCEFRCRNALCELSIYRENSQLKSEKLWEQVTHLVQKYPNCVSKYIILSTKIYYSVHKYVIQYINIYYWVSKYISDQALKYIRLPIKIISNCVPKYSRLRSNIF